MDEEDGPAEISVIEPCSFEAHVVSLQSRVLWRSRRLQQGASAVANQENVLMGAAAEAVNRTRA